MASKKRFVRLEPSEARRVGAAVVKQRLVQRKKTAVKRGRFVEPMTRQIKVEPKRPVRKSALAIERDRQRQVELERDLERQAVEKRRAQLTNGADRLGHATARSADSSRKFRRLFDDD